VLAFVRSQFRLGPESLLLGPARDRSRRERHRVQHGIHGAGPAARDQLLAAYSQRYGASFFLTPPDGDALVGPEVGLPRELTDRLHQRTPLRRRSAGSTISPQTRSAAARTAGAQRRPAPMTATRKAGDCHRKPPSW